MLDMTDNKQDKECGSSKELEKKEVVQNNYLRAFTSSSYLNSSIPSFNSDIG